MFAHIFNVIRIEHLVLLSCSQQGEVENVASAVGAILTLVEKTAEFVKYFRFQFLE